MFEHILKNILIFFTNTGRVRIVGRLYSVYNHWQPIIYVNNKQNIVNQASVEPTAWSRTVGNRPNDFGINHVSFNVGVNHNHMI